MQYITFAAFGPHHNGVEWGNEKVGQVRSGQVKSASVKEAGECGRWMYNLLFHIL